MTAAIPRPRSTSGLPRFVLYLDGVIVAVSGALGIVAARPIRDFFGVGSAALIVMLGVIFLLYAALLLQAARRRSVARRAVLLPAILNTAWVIGSVALLVIGEPAFSTGGKWAVALVADTVGSIAVLQFIALRQIPRVTQ